MRSPRFSLETLLAATGCLALALSAVRAPQDAVFFALVRNFAICVAAYTVAYLTASDWFLQVFREGDGQTRILLAPLIGVAAALLLMSFRLVRRPELSLELFLSWRTFWIGLLPTVLGAVQGWRARPVRDAGDPDE